MHVASTLMACITVSYIVCLSLQLQEARDCTKNTPESTCTDQKHWRETHSRHSGERDGEEVTLFTAFPFSSFKAGAWSCSYFNLLTLEPFSLCTIFPLSLCLSPFLALSLIYSNANSEPKLWEPRHNQCSYFCMHLNPSHVACML